MQKEEIAKNLPMIANTLGWSLSTFSYYLDETPDSLHRYMEHPETMDDTFLMKMFVIANARAKQEISIDNHDLSEHFRVSDLHTEAFVSSLKE